MRLRSLKARYFFASNFFRDLLRGGKNNRVHLSCGLRQRDSGYQ
jgi:hypothetical protein